MPRVIPLFLSIWFIIAGPAAMTAGAADAAADPAIPFATSSQNPLVAVYGLPPAAPATVLGTGKLAAELRADIASVCSRSSRQGEDILLDGESYRFTFGLKRGIGERFEIGLEIPYVMHRAGFLDSFISNWHDFFQLPQGERDDLPSDRLTYSYARDGRLRLGLEDAAEGFGDLRLTGAWQLWRQDGPAPQALALRASFKLPTGDDERLLGSGSTDLALWLSGAHSFRAGTLALFGAAGTLLMSDGQILAGQQRNAAVFGTLGGGWRPLPRLALKAQIDGHTACYGNSAVRELADSLQLVVGGTVGVTNTLALDIAVSEDIIVDTAPDIVFHLALRQTF